MLSKPEIFCPVMPFDRDVSRMSEDDLRQYAAELPSAEFPPVRWMGDGMDDLAYPDGARFGPPASDDLALLFGPGATQWQSISNRTVIDMGARLEQVQGRILGERGQSLSAPDQPAASRRAKEEAVAYAADQYSILAGNFATSSGPGSWRAADWCHSRYLDLWRQVAWLRGDYWAWLKGFLFRICLDNGIWLKYPLELAVVVILGFGLIFAAGFPADIRADSRMIAPECTPATLPVTSGGADVCSLAEINPPYVRVATALYFSAVTFTTVGYGDWHPVGWARLFGATEALSGITIMSAFTVILVRKIIR